MDMIFYLLGALMVFILMMTLLLLGILGTIEYIIKKISGGEDEKI